MSVGILDADLYQHGAVPFNLDIMKLSSYHKKNREIVSLTPFFCPEKYSKYEVRKDICDNDFRGFDLSDPRVRYGGLGFSAGRYVPMDMEIEKNIPDVAIYNKMGKYYLGAENKRLFDMMLNSKHIRLSLDGKNIWDDCLKYTNTPEKYHSLFIHDIDIVAIEGARRFLDDNIPSNSVHIESKFPIVTTTDKEFIDWFTMPNLGACNTIQHYGLLPDSSILEIINQPAARAERIEYFVVDYNTDTQDFVLNKLPVVLKQAVFLWNHQRKISLKYTVGVLPKKEIERFLELVDIYIKYSHLLRFEKTLYDFIKLLNWRANKGLSNFGFSIWELREIMTYIRDNSPETFDLCYSLSNTIYKGDRIENG